MKELGRNRPLATAAAKAGMSERTARRWRQRGMLPSETVKPRSWRTRENPFADVWQEVEAMLELDAGLEAKLIFEQLQGQYPERFRPGQLRTLLAERYERRSAMITSNLVFSQWNQIFHDDMTATAPIDRVVHHSVILELTVPSYRAEAARARTQGEKG